MRSRKSPRFVKGWVEVVNAEEWGKVWEIVLSSTKNLKINCGNREIILNTVIWGNVTNTKKGVDKLVWSGIKGLGVEMVTKKKKTSKARKRIKQEKKVNDTNVRSAKWK